MRNTAAEESTESFHPWNIPTSNLVRQSRGGRATDYSQCDFAKLATGRSRLIHASITPIEAGFFEGSVDPQEHRAFVPELLKLVSGLTAVRTALLLATRGRKAALREVTGILRNRGPLRRLLQATFLQYPARRISYLLSPEFDYWEELQREYDFLLAMDGKAHLSQAPTASEGRYDIVRSAEHLREIMGSEDGRIAVVLSIEGGHVFSMEHDGPVPETKIFERIEELKQWPHPIVFLTPAHHFDNGFCGHARSLVAAGQLIMDQTPRMHEGLEADGDLGGRVFRALLDIDEELNDLDGARIVLDSKHMSPLTRSQYYRRIVEPYNRSTTRRRPPIPVIHSHTGYSGVASLEALMEQQDCEDDHWHLDGYNAWGINVCDEDVHAVHDSGGLLGICFDQRIAGVTPSERVPAEHFGRVLARQVLAMVDVIMLDDRRDDEDKIGIWQRLCIGSDFDGVIHPLTSYSTALSLPQFASDLREILEEKRHTRMVDRIGVDELVECICWKNVTRFTEAQLEARL